MTGSNTCACCGREHDRRVSLCPECFRNGCSKFDRYTCEAPAEEVGNRA